MTQNSRGRSFVPTRVAGRAVAAGLSAGLVASVVAFAGPAFAAGTTTINSKASLTATNVETARLGGADRYATSVEFAKAWQTANGPADSVVLAAGDTLGPDALTAAALAGAANGPVLLTQGTSIPTTVLAELISLRDASTATNGLTVYIVGGTGVVSQGVEDTLKSFFTGTDQVVRLGGDNRFETAQKVAAKANALSANSTAILVNGLGLADALSAGPLANNKKSPIILTAADALPDAAKVALAGYTNVLVVGGTGVVSNNVITQAKAIVSGTVTRIAGGDNRYETSAQLAGYEATTGGFGTTDLVLARGDGDGPNFADALSAGAYAGSTPQPILLTAGPAAADIPSATAQYHVDNSTSIIKITAAGGPASISNAELGAAAAAAGDKYAPHFFLTAPLAAANTTGASGSLGSVDTLIKFTATAAGAAGNGVVVSVKTGAALAVTDGTKSVTITVPVNSDGSVAVTPAAVATQVNKGKASGGSDLVTAAAFSSAANTPPAAPTGSVTLSGGMTTVSATVKVDDSLLAVTPGNSNFGLALDPSTSPTIDIPAATKVKDNQDGTYTVTYTIGATQTYDATKAKVYVSGVADLAGNVNNAFVS